MLLLLLTAAAGGDAAAAAAAAAAIRCFVLRPHNRAILSQSFVYSSAAVGIIRAHTDMTTATRSHLMLKKIKPYWTLTLSAGKV